MWLTKTFNEQDHHSPKQNSCLDYVKIKLPHRRNALLLPWPRNSSTPPDRGSDRLQLNIKRIQESEGK